MRKAHHLIASCILIAFICVGCSSDGMLSRVPGITGSDRFLPQNNEVPGLVRTSKKLAYRGEDMASFLGNMAALYLNYGAENMATADYYIGSPDKTLSVEVYTMEQDVAAAGIFHYYRGKKLQNTGTKVDVGAEGVLDRYRENRNLYFYKKRQFFKIIYTGEKPIPSLVPLGRKLADAMGGETIKPKGFQFLDVDGIDGASAHVTPGYTFNCDFLPPGIFANAPACGPIAEVFLIEHHEQKDADKTGQDYRTYLELNGKDFTMKYGPNRRRVWWGRDPVQGRVICTVYGHWLIGVLRPRTYSTGEEMLDKMVARISQSYRR
ncbi:MAG: hypothetical protein JXR97_06365 [Planctomycetes bacterium]|nr:hypothetical protein [Planctomycetota bacterium]